MEKEVKSQAGRVLKMKCPKCGKSHLFINENIWSFQKLGQVKDSCEVCQANFKPEPGFYFGAAYVSWALTVATWVSVLVALKVFNALGWIEFGFLTHPATFLLSGIGISIITFPYMFQLSRSMWASWFIK